MRPKWQEADAKRMAKMDHTRYTLGSVVSLHDHPLTHDIINGLNYIDITTKWLITEKKQTDHDNFVVTLYAPPIVWSLNLWYVDEIHHTDP